MQEEPTIRPTPREPPSKKPRRSEDGEADTASMFRQVKADTGRILHILEKPREEARKQKVPFNEDLLRAARSVEALQHASGQHLVTDEGRNLLYCSVCAAENKDQEVTGGRVQSGMFRYDFGQKTSFSNSENLPTSFRLMKLAVTRHLKSAAHLMKAENNAKQAEANKAREKRAMTAEMNVLRTAYLLIKESGSGESFSNRILCHSICGTDVGNINHSKKLLPQARQAFCDVIIKKVKDHVASQPCVSVLADKVTINRRTVDVVAILTVVPGAPSSSIIQSYVVAAPVVKLHDGAGLAKEIQEALATIGITETDQLAAVAADGQYHRLGVPEKLLNLMRSEGGQQRAVGPACVAAIWDNAHLMNLAEADARKEHLWVQETVKSITEISKRFTYGKGLEELIDMGKTMGIKTKRPKLWSGTRFAPHAATVLSAFLHNWEPMEALLRERLQIEPRREYAAEILGDLQKLKGELFHIINQILSFQHLFL